ncbi:MULTISPECIES: hypothetical protein [Oscillatoriales]|uniref:hypothetical protein n=1 Tax=Oscillatoriophycideae TaxID=1301283 RepID=UPI001686B58C|nr:MULTISPECIES: hypothetical protein [Oscillatoriales]
MTKNRTDFIACRSPYQIVALQFGLTTYLGYFVKDKFRCDLDAIGLRSDRT